jgi:hypothetical protein
MVLGLLILILLCSVELLGVYAVMQNNKESDKKFEIQNSFDFFYTDF